MNEKLIDDRFTSVMTENDDNILNKNNGQNTNGN